MKILQIGDPLLNTKSKEVVEFNEELRSLIKRMIEMCKKVDNCGGLAAIQVGKPLRLSVLKKGSKWITIANPKVLNSTTKLSTEWEGCMSIGEGEKQLFGKVKRPYSVTIEYQDEYGQTKVTTVKGYDTHIFLHEIDHMNGVLFLNYIKDPTTLWTSKQLDDYIARHDDLP